MSPLELLLYSLAITPTLIVVALLVNIVGRDLLNEQGRVKQFGPKAVKK